MSQNHWDEVYSSKSADAVSWFEPEASMSLRLIERLDLPRHAPMIDVGGGASVLVGGLLDRGFSDLTVLDIAQPALQKAQARLADRAASVSWRCADITMVDLPAQHYQLWHDRAVFHFLTQPEQRAAYKAQLNAALADNGFFIIATFADDGPLQCSGLPICRYSAADLAREFNEFTMLHSEKYDHVTPWGAMQSFVFAVFKR